MWLGIQPTPLLTDIQAFLQADGFIARFLFMVCKPYYTHPDINEQYHELLKQENMHDFVGVMNNIYDIHKEGVTYKLSDEANNLFKQIGIDFYNLQKSKYDSDSDSNDDICCTPDSCHNSCEDYSSSTEPFHVLKLAAILHILNTVADAHITGNRAGNNDIPSTEIPLPSLVHAQKLYRIMKRHRYTLIESISSLASVTQCILKKSYLFL